LSSTFGSEPREQKRPTSIDTVFVLLQGQIEQGCADRFAYLLICLTENQWASRMKHS